MSENTPIAVLGAGSWGTALAIHLANNGHETRLWGRNAPMMAQLADDQRNVRYLPDTAFPSALTAHADLATALADDAAIFIVTPSHAFRETLDRIHTIRPTLGELAWATKGLEHGSGEFLHIIAADVFGPRLTPAVISGPTFAKELAAGLPAAIAVASPDKPFATAWATRLHGHRLRAYSNPDIIGVQLGGAVKNVLAVAAGIADGLQLGANTRAGMITRGLNEMMRLNTALGGQRETLMGLAGLGDLLLTCTDDQSRNRRLGLALARGLSIDEATTEIQQVVEGIPTAAEIWRLAERTGTVMPITEQVFAVLHQAKSPQAAVESLIHRQQIPENAP